MMKRSALSAGIRRLHGVMAVQRRHDDSDEQLLHAFTAQHDDNAFAVLVRRYGPLVLGVCRRVLRHHQDAEDAFQATFLLLSRNAAGLRDKTALASWLHGAAYRVALTAKRTAARRRKHESQAITRPLADPTEELPWSEVRALLDEEIARLPEIYRSVFVLCCLDNVSREEAARRLGLKEGTVSSRLTAARKRLAQRLARRGVELTAVLAASTLTSQSAPALPALLLASTIKAALSEATAGLVSAQVAVLMESAASAAVLNKAKIITTVLLTVSLLTGAWLTSATRLLPRAQTPAAASKPPVPQATNGETPRQDTSDVVTLKGRILGPNDKPIKGARLYSARRRGALVRDGAALAQREPTDETGRFHIRIKKPDSEGALFLIAHAAGFGVDWINLNAADPSSEVTLRLPRDVPITGRIVNTEGRPVAGATVSVAEVWVPQDEKLDDYLHRLLRRFDSRALYSVQKMLDAPLDAICGTATTDKDGRFTLTGAGGERIVQVAIAGGGVAQSTLFVITRPEFDAKPYNAALQNKNNPAGRMLVERRGFLGLYPPQLTFVAEAGKIIEGAVKDAETGKPVAGCMVYAQAGFQHPISAESNAEGKYRLEGLTKRVYGFNDMRINPPKDSTYLNSEVYQVPDKVGSSTIRLDFVLVKGSLITGRVVDKRNGKGVRCLIETAPLAGNKFFASKLAFNTGSRSSRNMSLAGPDGRFRAVALPGPSIVTAQVRESVIRGRFVRAYRQAVPDPDRKELFLEFRDTWRVQTAGNGFMHLLNENAAKVIDIKENGETRVELSVDPGVTARIVVQDADGKPLPGAWAAGLSDMRPNVDQLPEASATVYALNPKQPRTMAFYHAAKKLGGTATVRGDEKEPVVVKLAPLGKLSGRLLDRQGDPFKGVEVSIIPNSDIGSDLYRAADPTNEPIFTDEDGRFHIEGIVPDVRFWVRLFKDRVLDTEPDLNDKVIRPGETLDVGAVRVKSVE